VKRGEIRWYTFRLPDKRRPVLILTRNDVIDRLNEIIVVPATRTIRGLTTEVVLTVDDGMPAACALNFDHVSLAQRSRIGPVLCDLLETRWLRCGTRYSSRAASEDQAIEACETGTAQE
jgi:mRNA interferase MazF